ncbi:MAG: hypothetical protein MUF34_34520 [Polyangiaceae bacterium]|nr:hypothetical protein [Polyangiaceae bacterium]
MNDPSFSMPQALAAASKAPNLPRQALPQARPTPPHARQTLSRARRALAGLLGLAAGLLFTAIAWAGPYLDRAGLLLGEMHRANEFLQAHAGDKELAALIREAHAGDKELAALIREGAEARVRAARKMSVPKEVVPMHPHFLLALENAERAAAAAQEGVFDRFGHHLRVSRDEEGVFRSMLAQQKYELPSIAGK